MKNKISKLNALYLASAPALAIYLLPNKLPLIWMLILILFLMNLAVGKLNRCLTNRKNELQWFWAIMIIGFIGSIFNSSVFFDFTLYWHNLVNICFFFMALVIFTYNVDYSLLKKSLYVIGSAAALICLYQRAMLLLTGSFNVDVFIPWLEVQRDIETFSVNRVSAFFTEPAHLSIFLLPIFYMSLYDRKFILSALLASGVLFSGSTTGFLLLLALLVIFFIKSHIKKKYLFFFLVLCIALFVAVMTYFPSVFLDNMDKLNTTNTGSIRHLGPLSYLKYFNGLQWLFGIGLNQLSNFLSMNGVFLINEWGNKINANFANALIYSILSYGIIGFIFFLRYFIKLVKSNHSNLGFIIYAIGILASDQVLFNMNLLYVLTFLLLSKYLIHQQGNSSDVCSPKARVIKFNGSKLQ